MKEEIIKIRTYFNKVECKHKVETINKDKCWYFEKTNC